MLDYTFNAKRCTVTEIMYVNINNSIKITNKYLGMQIARFLSK